MQERPYQAIVVALTGGVCSITLNRPERRNAIGPQMVNELLYALEDAHGDAEVRSIVITGAGKAFCAGGDFVQMSGGEELPPKGEYKDLLLALVRTEKPTVARVNGPAMGGGLGIVAACTFAVAASDARLGTPEVDVGLFPFMILAVLERVMPRRRLVEMMLGGEKLSAEQALRDGLVNRVVAPEELDAAVKHYTDLVASKSPSTLKLGLRAMADAEPLSLAEKIPLLSERLTECIGTEDAREGLTAFLQKRAPVWTGR
jgi:enoyl-CoA hydratase/carnithine racemase